MLLKLSKVKLKFVKLCTSFKVPLELLVKLFQSRLDSSNFEFWLRRENSGNRKKRKLQNFLRGRWPNPATSSPFQSSCLNGCFWKFRGCFFVNFQNNFITEQLLLRFNKSSHLRYSVKKLLLRISHHSQENICARISF